MKIAARAGQRQVFGVVGTACRTRENMLDVKRRTLQRMVHLAVFTSTACSGDHDCRVSVETTMLGRLATEKMERFGAY